MPTGYLDNFYARLGVPRNALPDEIRNAYHQAARRFHPDTNKESGAVEVFLQIQESYETLSDPEKRAAYDKQLPPDLDTPQDIMVNAIYSRSVLPVLTSPQLVYVLLNMMALPDSQNKPGISTPPLNICLVLDTSTSMSGGRLDAVKETAITIIRTLKPEDILSVVTFNDKAEVIIPAMRGQNISMLEARISIINTNGGTEIGKGLAAGLSEINRNVNPSYHNHIMLITDGRTYGDENLCMDIAEESAKKGISLSCLGIGSQWNDEFLDSLANQTGGSSEFAANPQSIKEFLSKKFGQITNNYANNVILEYKTPPEVELRYAFRLTPDIGSLTISEELPLGDIPLGGSLSILMEFLVNSVSENIKEFTLADGNLRLTIPSSTIPQTNTKLSLSREVATEAKPDPPPQVLVKAMSRLSLYRMQEQAQKDLAEGDVNKAAQKLRNLSTRLLSSGQPELARTVLLEVDNIKNTQLLDESAQKRIKYGTRALVGEFGEETDL